ncbi:type I-C CRISPR-associated protein Cas5 [Limnothrix sp. FACHB-708]|nr:MULTISPECIES: type I-C CRISPR-associated protein Cas5c [unclassified Limnothrix]MBD2552554.1 type I-C CRISPR-associated protein Cas5 [Limnothrix sp. FACHB-708]MBD2589825.1 type I-C CRISPR-associated protein Cas5 [Limnothrix sp. FACHB-406]
MKNLNSLRVKFTAPYACFTRPEFKVERISYDVPTPSAMRGACEAIFWKPEMRYKIREIHVLKPIKYFSIWRNEVNSRQVFATAQGWAKKGEGSYFADDDRAQRHTLCLQDVAYVVDLDIEVLPHAAADVAKYRDQFQRRIERGQCHHQPYLGTREFSAFFEKPNPDHSADCADPSLNRELGLMLYDVEFQEQPKGPVSYRKRDQSGDRIVTAQAHPRFFRASLKQGVLTIPEQPLS